jgi:site-specific DNA recombinase
MKGVIYCRVSSKEQIEGTSLESQKVACREFAQSKKIDILKVFIEQGESAKFADRTQLLELIDFCRKNKGSVNVLLVWKVDRFARNVADHFSVKATLGKFGVRIMSVTEPIDANPEGKLMETILAGFAEFDNNIRAMRTVQGMRRKIQEGIFPWRPPLGYKSSVTAHEKKTLPDLPDEPPFSLIRRAFGEFATGFHTQAEMGRLMASWGLVAAEGKSLAPQSLHSLFTNKFYAGIIVDPWSGEEHPGKHAPLVSPGDFARVQQVLAARNRSVIHQIEREEFPLRGLVRCGACRLGLTAAFSRGRSSRYPYYLCQHHDCSRRGKSYSAAVVHSEFISFLSEIAPRPELVREIGERVIKAATPGERDLSAQRQRRRQRIGQLEKEINELIRMRAQNLINDEEFVIQKRLLADQRIALESQGQQRTNVAQMRADFEQIVQPLAVLRTTWESLKPPFRSRFDRLILPGGFLIGNIRTADLGLIFSTFRASVPTHSSVVALGSLPSNLIISEIHEFAEVIRSAAGTKSEAA